MNSRYDPLKVELSEPNESDGFRSVDLYRVFTNRRNELLRFSSSLTSDPALAEEAVHDALLYGLSGAPKLESELHAYRFLKWKTRMLVYDKVRKIDKFGTLGEWELEELAGPTPDPADSLVRAEDEAIVRAAIMRLSERQRSVLVAKYFLNQSGKETSSQLGMGTEAHKQLLLRARKSFKDNLVEILEERGLSVSDFLTNFRKTATKFTALSLLALVAVSSFGSLEAQLKPDLQGIVFDDRRLLTWPMDTGDSTVLAEGEDLFENNGAPLDAGANNFEVSTETSQAESNDSDYPANVSLVGLADEEFRIETQPRDEEQTLLASYLTAIIDEVEPSLLTVSNDNAQAVASGRQIALGSQGTSTIFIGLGTQSEQPIQYFNLVIEVDGLRFGISPRTLFSSVSSTPDGGRLIEVGATDFIAGDIQGNFDFVTSSETYLARSYMFLTLQLDALGEIQEFSTNFLERST